MVEAMILAVAESILSKLASFIVPGSVTEEIIAAMFAKKDLKIIAEKMEAICAVLEDAEDKRFTNKAIKIWLRDLKSVVYDIDDLLDEVAFNAKLCKVNEGSFGRRLRYYFSSSNPVVFSFHLSNKMKGLREKLENIVAKKIEFGLAEHPVDHPMNYSTDEIRDPLDECAYVHEPAIMGRDEAKKEILDKIYAASTSNATELSVLPILGMGGIGKTALAKLVYGEVQYFDLKLWVCVSEKFQIRQIIEDIVKDGSGVDMRNKDLNTLVKRLHDLLNAKKYFLVLDDVWVEDIAMWTKLHELLAIGKAGSLILITTRKASVASITQNLEAYDLERLPDHVCWSIFKRLAFKEGEEVRYWSLHEMGRTITRKCCGIPLVAITLGSLLRTERNDQEWQRIRDMDGFIELNQQYDKVMQLLKISYDKLPSHLKPCFVYMCLYMKDVNLSTNYVPYIWSALGLLRGTNGKSEIEECGYSYFMELVSRSLLQPNIRLDKFLCRAKMHDHLHDLAMNILGEELAVVTHDNMNVSEFSRHIVWGYEQINSLKDKEFPKELLKTRNTRTFRFGYRISHISRSILEGIITHFSCLRILSFAGSWFEELPASIGNLKHLRYLTLSYNPIIRSLPNTICKLLNLEGLHLDECEELKEIPRDLFQLQSLKKFTVTTCQLSLVGTKFNKFSSLHTLWFKSCKSLVSLWDSDNVGALSSLRFLFIIDCPKLTYFPNSMKFLVSLERLSINNCEELDLEKGEGLQGLQALKLLQITGVPKLRCLPRCLMSAAASLQYLFVENCKNLVKFPCWLQCFASLRQIRIEDCPNLLDLPEGFRHLKSLQLLIQNCPHLSERSTIPSDLIQHGPKIYLDDICFTPHRYQ